MSGMSEDPDGLRLRALPGRAPRPPRCRRARQPGPIRRASSPKSAPLIVRASPSRRRLSSVPARPIISPGHVAGRRRAAWLGATGSRESDCVRSPLQDRTYFRSIYFRMPDGILIEIATDGPGFMVDESPARLGQRLSLPEWLEHERAALERELAPIA